MAASRRPVLLGIVALVAAGAGYAGWQWWTEWRHLEATNNAYVAADMAPISPKVAGYIKAVAVTDNQRVAAGDLLVTIDDVELAASLAEAQASVAAAEAHVTSVATQAAQQARMIAKADSDVESALTEEEHAQRDLARSDKLAKDKWIAAQAMDDNQAAVDKAGSAVDGARATLAAEQGQLAVIAAQGKEAEAAVAQAKAKLALAQSNETATQILAPVDGVVGAKAVQVGQYVKAGTQIMAVVPLPAVHIVANFKETQLARMRPGQIVTITVDAYPDATVEGTVESFAPASGSEFSLLPPENATGNFTKIVQRIPVRIAVPANGPLAGLLRPGLSVEASVDTRTGGKGDGLVGGVFGAVKPVPSSSLAQSDMPNLK